jgi:hypothetical protein
MRVQPSRLMKIGVIPCSRVTAIPLLPMRIEHPVIKYIRIAS